MRSNRREVRQVNEQTIPEKLTEAARDYSTLLHDLIARCAALTRRLELAEAHRRVSRDQETNSVVREADDSLTPIELVTENGFSIVRPWERSHAPAPTGGICLFDVSDANGKERGISVTVSRQLIARTALHTCGRVQSSSSFWVCCAERHLADYLWEHDAFPDNDKLLVETLDPEEVLLALRWRRSKTD